MRKHMFIVRYNRDGTKEIDTYASCIWPIHSSGNDSATAKAYLAMIDGEVNLPHDVKQFMGASKWMWLRQRYAGGNTDGPYMINDENELIPDKEAMEEHIQSMSCEQLKKYLYRSRTGRQLA